MSITRKETVTTSVLHQYASRNGLTVGDLRNFLRDVEHAEIDDKTPVRHDHRLTHEGSAVSGSLSVEVRKTRDVPIVSAQSDSLAEEASA